MKKQLAFPEIIVSNLTNNPSATVFDQVSVDYERTVAIGRRACYRRPRHRTFMVWFPEIAVLRQARGKAQLRAI